MSWDFQEFQDRLADAIDAYDSGAVSALVDELIQHVRSTSDVYPVDKAQRVLQLLRRKRFFADLERAADAFTLGGQSSFRIRRLHAQALLDQSKVTAGIALLRALEADTAGDPEENTEARGLLGRAYKQAYVDAGGADTERSRGDLRKAVEWYHGVYKNDDEQLWHGINTVALLARAARDGFELEDYPKPATIAQAILTKVKDRRAGEEADAWDYATAAEACLALGLHDEALMWTRRYVDGSAADAFELASTLRQLEEIWQLTATDEPGRRVLPYLRAELLQREGARVDLAAGAAELAELTHLTRDTDGTYEAVLGTESFNNVKWLHTALIRAYSVARIHNMLEDEPWGTAFVVRAEEVGLEPLPNGELLLLTNSHVLGELDAVAVRPENASVNFEIDELGEPLRVGQLVKESAKAALDYTLFRTVPPLRDRTPIPLAQAIPVLRERVYIIGHPEGRSLKFSIYDNRLLNHVSPYLHYRTPTKGGSSGSPVMNRNWLLIGLHHMGDKLVPVPDEAGQHAANEGIAIHEIIRDFARP